MGLFNYYGLIIFVILMIPNIIYSFIYKDGFINKYENKVVLLIEKIGRIGSIVFLTFNIPATYSGFWFNNGLLIYIFVNIILVFIYILGWVILWKRSNLFKALLLSIIPSAIFIFSGLMIINIPLLVFSFTFAISHITISVKNVVML